MLNAATLIANPHAAEALANFDWQNEVREWAATNGHYGEVIENAIDDAALYGDFEGWTAYAIGFIRREESQDDYELMSAIAADRARGFDQ